MRGRVAGHVPVGAGPIASLGSQISKVNCFPILICLANAPVERIAVHISNHLRVPSSQKVNYYSSLLIENYDHYISVIMTLFKQLD